MGKIQEVIEILGADRSEQELRRIARAEGKLGDETEKAGAKGKGAAGDFGSMNSALKALPASAASMVAGFASFEGVKAAFREFLDILKEIEEIQQRLSGQTVELANASKILSKQLGVTEEQGMKTMRGLKVAGGFDEGTAQAFGVGADIAFQPQGGLLGGENLKTAKQVAGFVGATGMQGQAASDLMRFLQKTGQLKTPEAAKAALAKIKAAAAASDAASIGEFVSQLLKGGMGMAQAGLSLDDILTVGGQAVGVESSGELAAQSMKDLEALATGAEEKFTREIERAARKRGLDPKKLTTAQRIGITRDIFGGITTQEEEDRVRAMMSAERGVRLIKAYRASNVEATAGVSAGAAGATAGDFETMVDEYKETVSYQDAASRARGKYAAAEQGRDTFFRDKLRREAKEYVERGKASGRFGLGKQLLSSDEALEEHEMKMRLDQMAWELRESGLLSEEDLQEAAAAEEALGPGNQFTGFADQLLLKYAQTVERLRQKAAAAKAGGAPAVPPGGTRAPATAPAEAPAGATVIQANTVQMNVAPGKFSPVRVSPHD